MTYAGMVRTSLIDYPGHPACVLFTAGCNYDCFYCHNRSAIDGSEPTMSASVVHGFLEKRQGILEAVVISGGEPTLHGDLEELCVQVKSLGYLVKLDTNGSHPQVVQRLLQAHLVDCIAMDVKASWERYPQLCGPQAEPAMVQRTLEVLMACAIPWEIRTTVAPTLALQDLLEMASTLPTLPVWHLNVYRVPLHYRISDGPRISAWAPPRTVLEQWLVNIRSIQPNTSIS